MRDKLIKLIKQAPKEMWADEFADYLLENGVIVSPCKVGDTVYRVVKMGTGVSFKKVGYNTWQEKEQTIKRFIRPVTITKNNFYNIVIGDDFGKTVFLTKEEAKQALKGGEG